MLGTIKWKIKERAAKAWREQNPQKKSMLRKTGICRTPCPLPPTFFSCSSSSPFVSPTMVSMPLVQATFPRTCPPLPRCHLWLFSSFSYIEGKAFRHGDIVRLQTFLTAFYWVLNRRMFWVNCSSAMETLFCWPQCWAKAQNFLGSMLSVSILGVFGLVLSYHPTDLPTEIGFVIIARCVISQHLCHSSLMVLLRLSTSLCSRNSSSRSVIGSLLSVSIDPHSRLSSIFVWSLASLCVSKVSLD